ncbi:hypothetical protein L6164_001120 [Bauhinia variegata]|uniref:Uncharacterized protein n=1 Tax=Bauhinia variegata TaxID=167791 RepID=A0ACB9Q8Y5_BAUVA|nr:hypothetical protein L6164_001120 [Bauhinia variegata]
MIKVFCGKILEEKEIHVMDLGRLKQQKNEGVLAFIRCYKDKALLYKESLVDKDLVYGCIVGIKNET